MKFSKAVLTLAFATTVLGSNDPVDLVKKANPQSDYTFYSITGKSAATSFGLDTTNYPSSGLNPGPRTGELSQATTTSGSQTSSTTQSFVGLNSGPSSTGVHLSSTTQSGSSGSGSSGSQSFTGLNSGPSSTGVHFFNNKQRFLCSIKCCQLCYVIRCIQWCFIYSV